MIATLTHNNKTIAYQTDGNGPAVVLLHGFLETSSIWDDYTHAFAADWQIIRVNLPGHGGTESLGNTNSMDEMAGCVKAVLDHLGVDEAIVVGHSMGGYVGLAFAALFGDMVRGLCLFHSTSQADSEEKKANRLRAVEAVTADRTAFVRMAIPNLFAPANVALFVAEIELLKSAASEIEAADIAACLRGMRERPDRQHVLAAAVFPVMWIAGKQDNAVPYETVEPQLSLPPDSTAVIFEEVGHMGFIEEKEACRNALTGFFESC